MASDCPRDLVIGVVEHPKQSPLWPDIEEYLIPAAMRGGMADLICAHELCWACLLDGRVIGAATTRMTVGKACEVVLVGGVERELWLAELDQRIGACAREAGATVLRAFGRRGWVRDLKRQGWAACGQEGGIVAYERGLLNE